MLPKEPPHKIPRPYEVNAKTYTIIFLMIGLPFVSLLSFEAIGLLSTYSHIASIIENFLIGLLGSTFAALLLDIGNVRCSNQGFELQQKQLFEELCFSVRTFCKFFSTACLAVRKAGPALENESKNRHTWYEWFLLLKKETSIPEKLIENGYKALFTVSEYPIEEIQKIIAEEETLRVTRHIDSQTMVLLKEIQKSFQILREELEGGDKEKIAVVLKTLYIDFNKTELLTQINEPFSINS